MLAKDLCEKQKNMNHSANVKRIPFKHIDQINLAVKELKKVQVRFNNDFKSNMFSIDGQFPTFISTINHDNENIQNVDIQVGDYIIIINNQNVSRASAKTVRKIIKSNSVLHMTLYRPDEKSLNKVLLNCSKKQNLKKQVKLISLVKRNISSQQKKIKCLMSCITSAHRQKNHDKCQKVNEINNHVTLSSFSEMKSNNEESADYGYHSIPRTCFSSSSILSFNSPTILSTSSTECNIQITNQLASSVNSNVVKDINLAINDFLQKIQCLIDVYVRPCMVFKILSTEQSFGLFQNVEKLIPVTRFLLNIFSSSFDRLPNAESMKIAFDAFKTYLVGLPNAIALLDSLTMKNDKFALFLEKLHDEKQLKMFDLLFVPFRLVQTLIESISSMLKFDTENSFNSAQLHNIMQDLFECSVQIYENLNDMYEANKRNADSFTSISDYSEFYSFSFDSQKDCDSKTARNISIKPLHSSINNFSCNK